jgi:glycine dehydrogenase subunit 2
VVPQPFTIEPTESYSKAELDEYLAGLQQVSDESYVDAEYVKAAPHCSVVHRAETHLLDDPQTWAITWRAYLKKRQNW